jgi:hypothetical protein
LAHGLPDDTKEVRGNGGGLMGGGKGVEVSEKGVVIVMRRVISM